MIEINLLTNYLSILERKGFDTCELDRDDDRAGVVLYLYATGARDTIGGDGAGRCF